MSITDEFEVIDLTKSASILALQINENEEAKLKAQERIIKADKIMKKNIQGVFTNFGLETIISFAETALKVPLPDNRDLASEYLDIFFKYINNKGQFLVRALILKATLKSNEAQKKSLKAMDNVKNAEQAIEYIFQAIKIISNEQSTGKKGGGEKVDEKTKSYSFLIYNISVCVYNIIRPFFRKGWLNHFLKIVQQVDDLLAGVEEPNQDWRARFSWVLFNSLYDDEKKQDAYKTFDNLWVKCKEKINPEFQETLLRHRIHFAKEYPAALSAIEKELNDLKLCPPEKGLRYLVELQKMKSGITPDTNVDKELHKLLYNISPQILTSEETISNTKLTANLQERLAEASRVAIHFNLISIADKILNFLQRNRQNSHKTYIWIEYSKAEILVKKAGNNIDPKTGIRLNQTQMREQEIERRKEALNILEKTMNTNRLKDPDLIYEGCVLIWNIGLPFVNESFKEFIVDPFLRASELLEDIQSTDHELRVKLHMELAKIYMQDNHKKKAENHIHKALKLDYSLPEKVLPILKDSKEIREEDPAQYQRVFDRYLLFMEQKIKQRSPITTDPLEKVLDLLEAAQTDKQTSTQETNLHEALNLLKGMQQKDYVYDESKNLVEAERNIEKQSYRFKQIETYKRKKLLIGTIVKLAYQFKLHKLVEHAAEEIIHEDWVRLAGKAEDEASKARVKNAKEMIANQIETLHLLAQTKIYDLINSNIEPAFDEISSINPKKEMSLAEEKTPEQIRQIKVDIVDYHLKALDLINQIQQNWMIFNGAINTWNNYLMTFKNPLNDEKLLPEIVKLLDRYFKAMENSIKDIEKKMLADYDIDSKIQVYGNMGIILARLLEGKGKFDVVLLISESLLHAPLSPHTRKLVNSIKARVSTSTKGGSKVVAAAPSKGGPGGQQNIGQNNNDQILFKVVNHLEIIQNNTNKNQTPTLIKECFNLLSSWKLRDNDETDLELHAELWTKLSKLALNDQSTAMYKYSLLCIENALSVLNDEIDLSSIPTNRLRWYSLADYLYGETLCRMVNPDTQEPESQETIYLHALNHILQAANKGSKARNFQLVVDAAKKFWDITSKLKSAYTNRKILIKPIFSLLYYLKVVKDETFNEDLVLWLLNVLNQGCMENDEWVLGETAADMCLELVPSDYKKHIWNWKMVFMSKQGKDELSIMNNIKECDPFLQAKVWIKLARTATQVTKQYTAFSNAIEVLKKEESVGIVPILIEFSEWLLRNKYDVSIVRENLLMSSDILLEIEEVEEEDLAEGSQDSLNDQQTIFSRSSRGKKSVFSKASGLDQRSKRDNNANPSNLNLSRMQKKGAATESRMNKITKRDVKTVNSESQKLILAQNDEENFVGKLNIKHFDQLLRIHAMLAIVSDNSEKLLQYCLDTKFFMIKILEMTYASLNNLREMTEIVKSDDDKKASNTQVADKKLLMLPATLPEWINFEFPQELISRISTNYESNIFCKYVFDSPELTLYYLEQILTDLEKFGLHVHCVPIFKFSILMADKVIQNKHLVLALQLRFAKCICSLGYAAEAKEVYQKVISQISVTPQEFTARFNELNRMRPSGHKTGGLGQAQANNQRSCRVITSYLPYEGWLAIAKELIHFGQFSLARSMLDESKRHASYLAISEQIGEIDLSLSFIELHEGLYNEALISQMRSHKLIRSPYLWEESILKTFELLVLLGKWNDAHFFLEKLISTYKECLKSKDFEDTHMKLGWCISTASLCKTELILRNLITKFDKNQFKDMTTQLKIFVSMANKYGVNLNHSLQVSKLMTICEKEISKRPVGDETEFKNSYRLVNTFIKMGHKMDSLAKENLKYIFAPGLESKIRSPLVTFHNRTKLALARLYIIFGDLAMKAQHMRISINKVDAVEAEEDGLENEEEPDRQLDLYKNLPPAHVAYLTKLNREIEKLGQKSKKRLDSFERASSLAKEVENTSFLPEDTVFAKIEYFRGLRRRNAKIGNLRGAEHREAEPSNQGYDEVPHAEREKYSRDLLTSMKEIKELTVILSDDKSKESAENGIFDYCRNDDIFRTLKRVYYEELEIWTGGFGEPEETLSALMKFQDYQTFDYLSSVVKTHCRKTSRVYLLKCLLQEQYHLYNYLDKPLLDDLSQNHRLVTFFNARQDFFEMTDKMAVNTAYLSIQLSEEGSEIFIGFVRRCENDKYVYDCRKFKLLETTAGKLDYLIEQQAGAVSNYYKTPLLTKADQNALQEECSHIMAKVRNDMESIFGVYLQHLDEFINLEPPVESPEEVNTSPGGKPAAQKAKDAGKKPDPKGGNKKDVGISHEVLVPSKSGIDHIVMFVDERYILLPFQLLPLVKDVPLISKDYSLQTYTKRIETMSAENGGENLSLNKTQYIAYDFKDAEGELDEARSPIKFSSMMDALKSSNNVSLQGVNSNQRIPSLGNWQLSLRESDTLIYYGNKPFLHLLSPAMLLDLVNTCRTRCFMISDRINPIKKHIAKFDSLDEDQDLVMIKEMPKLSLALLTIMGAAVIVYNQGPIDPEYNLEIFYGILGGITNTAGVANQSFSKALAEHRAGRKTLLIPGNDKPVGPAGYPRASVEHPVQATKGGAKAQPAHIQKDKPQGEEGYEEYSEIMISQYSILGVGSTRLEARETK